MESRARACLSKALVRLRLPGVRWADPLPRAAPARATIAHGGALVGRAHPALIATAVGAAVLVAGARRWGDAWAVPAGRGLALVILSGFVCEQLTYALRGQWTAEVNLPLQLTDAVTLVSVAALWRPESALLVELVYFWALSASLQAVLTPDLGQSFPDLLFFTYFATHSGAIAAACLLVFGARRAPRPDAVWRVYAITVAFTGLAAVGTLLTGGNYMFLRHKPAHGSLLDLMGPWPVYILAAALLAAVMFLALAALARLISARSLPSTISIRPPSGAQACPPGRTHERAPPPPPEPPNSPEPPPTTPPKRIAASRPKQLLRQPGRFEGLTRPAKNSKRIALSSRTVITTEQSYLTSPIYGPPPSKVRVVGYTVLVEAQRVSDAGPKSISLLASSSRRRCRRTAASPHRG